MNQCSVAADFKVIVVNHSFVFLEIRHKSDIFPKHIQLMISTRIDTKSAEAISFFNCCFTLTSARRDSTSDDIGSM